MMRLTATLAVACVVVLTLAGCAKTTPSKSTETAAPAGAAASQEETSASDSTKEPGTPAEEGTTKSSGVTMAQFNKIKKGMTYAEVVAILGEPAQTTGEGEAAGIKFAIYSWTGEKTASAVSVNFQDGKADAMSQLGLD